MSPLRRSMEITFLQDLLYTEFPLSETPFISTVDAENEIIIVSNPSSVEISLANFIVVDFRKLHRFKFPVDTKIPPHGDIHLYTCPGGHSPEPPNAWREPYVFWRNNDGSLRRKEVLNNGRCYLSYLEHIKSH